MITLATVVTLTMARFDKCTYKKQYIDNASQLVILFGFHTTQFNNHSISTLAT